MYDVTNVEPQICNEGSTRRRTVLRACGTATGLGS